MDAMELFGAGQSHFVKGEYRESLDFFTRALKEGGPAGPLHLSCGVARMVLKEFEPAIEDFSKVLELDGNNVKALLYRGTAYLGCEKYEQAVDDFSSVVKLQPDHGAAYLSRGTGYARLGREAEAAEDLKIALRHSETAMQGFAHSHGMFRTQFNDILTRMGGKDSEADLSEEEIGKLKELMGEE